MINKFLLLTLLPMFLFAGEAKWYGRGIHNISVVANGCYVIVTTKRNPYPVSMKYTLPDNLVSIRKYGDSLEIKAGKATIDDSSDVLNIQIKKHVDKTDTININLYPDKDCNLKLKFGAVNAKIIFSESKFKNLSLKSGVSDVLLDFNGAGRMRLDKIDIAGGVSKLRIKKLLNSGADTVNMEAGVSKQIVDLSGRLKRSMFIDMDAGLSMTTIITDRKVPLKIDSDNDVISSITIPDNFVRTGDGIYKSKYYEGRGKSIELKIGNSMGSVDIIER